MTTTPIETLGIIGAGNVGAQIARRAIAVGLDVVLANSRGPETLESCTYLDARTFRGLERWRPSSQGSFDESDVSQAHYWWRYDQLCEPKGSHPSQS